MARFLLGRAASMALTLAVASLVVFGVVEGVPGDPARFMLGTGATAETVAALRDELGLTGGFWTRYAAWVSGLVAGDFGTSYTYRVPVADLVTARLGVTLPLTALALVLAVAVALPAGVLAASLRGRPADLGVTGATQLGIAVPNFWFAMLLVLVFAVTLGWLPAGGFPGWDAGIWPALRSLVLPAVALALPQASILTRVLRGALIETLDQDYVRTARAKGLTRGEATRRHALRNALIPVMTILGLQVAFLLAGAIVIERVFFLPGLGQLVFQGITQRDLIVVESVVMMLVAAVVLTAFAVDVAYAVVDPRLRR